MGWVRVSPLIFFSPPPPRPLPSSDQPFLLILLAYWLLYPPSILQSSESYVPLHTTNCPSSNSDIHVAIQSYLYVSDHTHSYSVNQQGNPRGKRTMDQMLRLGSVRLWSWQEHSPLMLNVNPMYWLKPYIRHPLAPNYYLEFFPSQIFASWSILVTYSLIIPSLSCVLGICLPGMLSHRTDSKFRFEARMRQWRFGQPFKAVCSSCYLCGVICFKFWGQMNCPWPSVE